MAGPTNREEFANYCLRKLGEPVIKVNVAVEQIEDRIDEALYKFYERNYNAVEDEYLLLVVNEDDISRGYFNLPEDIVGVVDVFVPSIASSSAPEFRYYLNDLFGYAAQSTYGNLSYYVMVRSYIELINRYFVPQKTYSFNYVTHKLKIAGGLKATYNAQGFIVAKVFRKVQGHGNDAEEVSNLEYHNIWKIKWLQDYATALIELQWGKNTGKYQNVQLLGGVTMNGEQIMTRAEATIEKLEIQLQLEFELPPMFFLG